MTKQIKTEFIGKKIHRSWGEEKPLWWILWRTHAGGHWNDEDKNEFMACKAKYLIMLDHTHDTKARELALYLIDRFTFFKGAKVSKFARNGEKTLVLLGRDDSLRDSLAEFVKQWNMVLWGVKDAKYVSDAEKQANAQWGDYLHKLARAHGAGPKSGKTPG